MGLKNTKNHIMNEIYSYLILDRCQQVPYFVVIQMCVCEFTLCFNSSRMCRKKKYVSKLSYATFFCFPPSFIRTLFDKKRANKYIFFCISNDFNIVTNLSFHGMCARVCVCVCVCNILFLDFYSSRRVH